MQSATCQTPPSTLPLTLSRGFHETLRLAGLQTGRLFREQCRCRAALSSAAERRNIHSIRTALLKTTTLKSVSEFHQRREDPGRLSLLCTAPGEGLLEGFAWLQMRWRPSETGRLKMAGIAALFLFCFSKSHKQPIGAEAWLCRKRNSPPTSCLSKDVADFLKIPFWIHCSPFC